MKKGAVSFPAALVELFSSKTNRQPQHSERGAQFVRAQGTKALHEIVTEGEHGLKGISHSLYQILSGAHPKLTRHIGIVSNCIRKESCGSYRARIVIQRVPDCLRVEMPVGLKCMPAGR